MVRSYNRSQVPTKNIERARAMRACPTESEAALWRVLSGKKLGVSFRRQVPFGNFILDFLAPAARLAIEVDGGCHSSRKGADARKDRALLRSGYRILRVEAERVMKDLPGVVRQICAALGGE